VGTGGGGGGVGRGTGGLGEGGRAGVLLGCGGGGVVPSYFQTGLFRQFGAGSSSVKCLQLL